MTHFRKILGAAAAALLLSGAVGASNAAWIIDAGNLTQGQNSITLDVSTINGNTEGPIVDVTASTNFKQKNTPGGRIAVGTQGGQVDGEIGSIGTGEHITFSFDRPVFLSQFTIAWLFPDGQYGDVGNEIAVFTVDGQRFELEATGFTSGVLRNSIGDVILDTGSLGGISVLEQAKEPHGGVFQLSAANIFGNFSTLVLQGSEPAMGHQGSDFSFVSMEGAAVIPVPAALPLMVTGLAALGLLRWRRRRDA